MVTFVKLLKFIRVLDKLSVIKFQLNLTSTPNIVPFSQIS